MYDNNEKELNKEPINLDENEASIIILKNMINELEEELYSVKIEIKAQTNLCNEKELELGERERTKIHNLDLFSPIYNKSHDTKELLSSIDQMKYKIEELNTKQLTLCERMKGLNAAVLFIEDNINKVKASSEKKNSKNNAKISDKGLSILEAQEMERQRIARELHDSTVQNLTSLVHKSELCIKLIDIDTIRAKLELNAMSNTIKTVINDMRGIIYNLKPMSLDDLGLTVTVERYAYKMQDANNIHIIVTSNEETKEILPVIKLTLFRIIQEACHNVIKHANASMIDININYKDDNKVVVTIEDDGDGFCIKEKMDAAQPSSFGLSIMRERISLLSGTVDIQSEKGKGTIVTVSAPLTVCEEEKDE